MLGMLMLRNKNRERGWNSLIGRERMIELKDSQEN